MTLLWVGFAGALGALVRYGVSVAALRWWGAGFPLGTLIVNLVGCFLLGMVTELGVERGMISPELRAVLGTGFLGALTTFSTFGVETFRAAEVGQWGVAAVNVGLNLAGGLALVGCGVWAARQI